MSIRDLPVRPNLDQLKHQAKDLLRQFRSSDQTAIEEFKQHHHSPPDPALAKLADAQLVLARMYQASSWNRIVLACQLTNAIWEDDIVTVRRLVVKNPFLIHENALIRESNWGRPMSYAANLGRNAIIQMLHSFGATDLEHAIGRAILQGQVDTAQMLHNMLGRPIPESEALGGPAYTLNISGTEFLLGLGLAIVDAEGRSLAPVSVVLETDSRKPEAKHRILELYVEHGLQLPDTPTMALHRGRIDLLESHLQRNPDLLSKRFTHEEIYPPELGCHDEILATHGTPLAGSTLLHMCIDYDEMEIVEWLIAKGMDVNIKAAVDADGFGGHSPLFSTVVSQPNFWMNHHKLPQTAPFTKLLLDHGADPNARASLRKQLHPGYGEEQMHEYRDVTPLSWGERFHRQIFVNHAALQLITEHGGER